MKRLPDISEYYHGDLAMKEENAWQRAGGHNVYSDYVNQVVDKYELHSAVEFGCATGHTAIGLNPRIDYLGIDRNEWFLEKARERCPAFHFVNQDVREPLYKNYDLSMAFAFVKHFGLHEVNEVVDRILKSGRYCVLQMQFLDWPDDLDDGTAYHHVFVTEERMTRVVDDAGCRELDRQLIGDFDHPVARARNVLCLYGRK